jgi:hypothetical protein
MEYLTAATVFGQPLPHLEEPTRQIVYFDPVFDAQIGWGAGQSAAPQSYIRLVTSYSAMQLIPVEGSVWRRSLVSLQKRLTVIVLTGSCRRRCERRRCAG